MAHIVSVLLLLLSVVACSSTSRQRDLLAQLDSPEKAARYYERVIAQDPQDIQAREGLKDARLKLIADQLISIRFQRLAGDPDGAAVRLIKLLEQEKVWSLFPTDAVAFTQQEETDLAILNASSQIDQALRQSYPLRASWLIQKYQVWFQMLPAERQERILNQLAELGREECNNLKLSLKRQRPHYRRFAEALCTTYGTPVASSSEVLPRADFISELHIKVDDPRDFPRGFIENLRHDLTEVLRTTPWYDERVGRRLTLNIKGTYLFRHRKQIILRPLSVRQSPFAGWRHHQEMVFDLAAEADFGDGKLKFQHQTRDEIVRKENLHSPYHSAHLQPQTIRLPSHKKWRAQQVLKFSTEFYANLQQAWRHQFCSTGIAPNTLSNTNEALYACLRLNDHFVPRHVQHWLQSRYGLTTDEINDVLPLNSHSEELLLHKRTAKKTEGTPFLSL